MKLNSIFLVIPLMGFGLFLTAEARDLVVPAGTLLTCTLDEPKFSSATVAVGDPFLCYPRNLQQFGQTVFPRGAYIVGHLEDDREPGRLVGKGYLRLAFDRIGLPSADVPINAKVIAVAGFNVDREGKIIGHGHATRDTVEWLLPPLWPWKILTLPARGPRPTLKGETRVMLRVMDDFVVPQVQSQGWHRFGEEPSSFLAPGPGLVPRQIAVTNAKMVTEPQTGGANAPHVIPASLEQARPFELASDGISNQEAVAANTNHAWAAGITLFALTDGTLFPASQYWRDQDQLVYVSDGDRGSVSLKAVDWGTTTRLNAARNVRVTLRRAPADN